MRRMTRVLADGTFRRSSSSRSTYSIQISIDDFAAHGDVSKVRRVFEQTATVHVQRQPGHDRANRHVNDGRDFFVRQAFHFAQHQDTRENRPEAARSLLSRARRCPGAAVALPDPVRHRMARFARRRAIPFPYTADRFAGPAVPRVPNNREKPRPRVVIPGATRSTLSARTHASCTTSSASRRSASATARS